MAGEILDRLTTFMGGRTDDGMFGTKPIFAEEMFDKMFEFIVSLDPAQLTEEQAGSIVEMIEEIELEYEGVDESDDYDLDEEEDLDEAPKRVKVNKSARRARAKAYRKNKAKRKMAAKKYRKSSAGKMMAKKAKRNSKRGKTATGKRKVTYR